MSAALDKAALRRERLARLREQLQKADCAAGLFLDPINIRYATDSSNMQVWCLHNPVRYAFVATSGPVVLFEFETCEHLASGIATIDETRPSRAWTYLIAGPEGEAAAGDWAAEIEDLMRRHGSGNRRLAVDRVDAIGFQALRKLGVEVVDGQALAEQARLIKTPQEQRAIRNAIAACEAGVHAMQAGFEPGMTEQQLWSILHQQNIAAGGEWIETRLLAAGPRTNPWYQECSDYVIAESDLVALDTDLIGLAGYCCDISRTWSPYDRRADDAQRATYARAYSHLQNLMALVGPGKALSDITDAIGRRPEDDNTYSCLLHGVGLCDEYPVGFWLDQGGRYDAVLQPGMTLCIESYLGPKAGGQGVKLEEQVLVTEGGIDVLSSLPFEEDWL